MGLPITIRPKGTAMTPETFKLPQTAKIRDRYVTDIFLDSSEAHCYSSGRAIRKISILWNKALGWGSQETSPCSGHRSNQGDLAMLENSTGLKEIVAKRIDHLKQRPKVGIYKPKVTSKLIRNLYSENRVRDHLVKCDYAQPAGGENLAPNPIELLLASLASCIEAAFHEFVAHEGFVIESVEAEIQGTLDLRGLFMVDDSVRPGFQDLQYALRIRTPDNVDAVRQLAEKVIAHCPVVDSLINPVALSGAIEINAGAACHK